MDALPRMGECFRGAGYETAYVGKWHCLTGGDRRGFEDYVIRLGTYDTDTDEQNDWLQHALWKINKIDTVWAETCPPILLPDTSFPARQSESHEERMGQM